MMGGIRTWKEWSRCASLKYRVVFPIIMPWRNTRMEGGIGLTKFLILLLVKKSSNQTNQKTNNRLLDIYQSPRRASWFS